MTKLTEGEWETFAIFLIVSCIITTVVFVGTIATAGIVAILSHPQEVSEFWNWLK